MKTMRFLIPIFGLLAVTAICRAQTTDPGWFVVPDGTQPDSLPSDGSLQETDPPTPEQPPAFHANFVLPTPPAIAEPITPEIQALASSLQNDPVKIYNYVHDNIRFVLYFGSNKGAQLTLFEK